MRRDLSIFCLFAAGCGSTDSPPTGCPLSVQAEQLLVQLVNQTDSSLSNVLANSDGQQNLEVPFALLGVDQVQTVGIHLAAACTATAASSEPTCSSDLPGMPPITPELDTCFVTGCDAARVPFAEAYVTALPHRNASDRITISLRTSDGQVTYQPNPLVHWSFEASEPGLAIMADPSVTIDAFGLDFSYSGKLIGTKTPIGLDYTADLTLPGLSSQGAVSVTLHNASTETRTGSIVVGDMQLGVISQAGVSFTCHQ